LSRSQPQSIIIILSLHHTIGGKKKFYGVEDSYRSSYSETETRSVSSRSCDPQTGHSSHLRKQPSQVQLHPKSKTKAASTAVSCATTNRSKSRPVLALWWSETLEPQPSCAAQMHCSAAVMDGHLLTISPSQWQHPPTVSKHGWPLAIALVRSLCAPG
jgi:hypothetical protein